MSQYAEQLANNYPDIKRLKNATKTFKEMQESKADRKEAVKRKLKEMLRN